MNRAKHPKEKNVLVISDYPILSEIERDLPYSSASNLQLLSDLHKVGIKQLDSYHTYLSYTRPDKDNFDFNTFFSKHKNIDIISNWVKLEHEKDLYVHIDFWNNFLELLEEIKKVKPKLIIITGKWALFFLTGMIKYSSTQGNFKSLKPLGGINKYRASIMRIYPLYEYPDCIVMPIYPPTTKQREPSKIPVMNLDYKKLGYIYNDILTKNNLIEWLFPLRKPILGTNSTIITEYLTNLLNLLNDQPLFVSVDIETRHGTVDCIGITPLVTAGLVIPFSTIENPNPWSFEEELSITMLMLEVLTNKNTKIVGQNFSYDSQYLNKFYLVNLHPSLDTMIANHVLYNYMQKDLSFLASIYVDTFSQWKDLQKHGKEVK